jgi:hypothetical protein
MTTTTTAAPAEDASSTSREQLTASREALLTAKKNLLVNIISQHRQSNITSSVRDYILNETGLPLISLTGTEDPATVKITADPSVPAEFLTDSGAAHYLKEAEAAKTEWTAKVVKTLHHVIDGHFLTFERASTIMVGAGLPELRQMQVWKVDVVFPGHVRWKAAEDLDVRHIEQEIREKMTAVLQEIAGADVTLGVNDLRPHVYREQATTYVLADEGTAS